jgi:DNA-binding FrmR family transcriptional regulator
MAKRISSGYAEERDDLLRRVRKIEGQARGVGQMIENDRYCLDIVQQINAITAAAREISLMVLEAHLRACVREAVKDNGGEAAIQEMVTVLRRTLRP